MPITLLCMDLQKASQSGHPALNSKQCVSRRACLALPQTETTPIGPLTLRSTLRACGGISNFPVSVEYLTSSRGEPGCAAGAEKLMVSTGLAFLPPHMNDIFNRSC